MFNSMTTTPSFVKKKAPLANRPEHLAKSSWAWQDLALEDHSEQNFFPQNAFVPQYNLLQSSNDFTSFHGSADEGFLAGATQEGTPMPNFQSSHRYLSDNRTIHPMKISMIQHYFHQNPQEHRLKCFDQEINTFKLIGLIRHLHIDETVHKWTFTVDDGTGVIQVAWLPLRHMEYPDIEVSPWFKDQLASIRDNVYARVYGDIDLLGHLTPRVAAFFVSHLEIMDEIFYHDIRFAEWIFSNQIDETVPATKCQESYESGISSSHFSSERGLPTQEVTPLTLTRTPKPIVKLIRKDTESFKPSIHPNDEPKMKNMNDSSQSILDTLANTVSIRPNGLTAEELLFHLLGRGLKVSLEDTKKNLKHLESLRRVVETSSHCWCLTEHVDKHM